MSGVLSLLKHWKWLVIICLLGIVGVQYLQSESLQEKIEEKTIQISNLKGSNESLKESLDNIQESYERQSVRLENLSASTRSLQEKNNRLQSELGGYKDREEIVFKKPKLVERRANDAVANLMCEYERATNPNSDCGKNNN